MQIIPATSTAPPVRLLSYRLPAGFPSPAADYAEDEIDLGALLIDNPAATYVMRVEGRSMEGAGIHSGDFAVIDRSIDPRDRHIVVACVEGDYTIKRLRKSREGRFFLVAEADGYKPIPCTEDVTVWGVVRSVVSMKL